jgi:hypothetical protein
MNNSVNSVTVGDASAAIGGIKTKQNSRRVRMGWMGLKRQDKEPELSGRGLTFRWPIFSKPVEHCRRKCAPPLLGLHKLGFFTLAEGLPE